MAEVEGIQIELITPDRVVFCGVVEDVILPGVEGEFGVLKGHETFLSGLDYGVMSFSVASGKRTYCAIGEGYVEVTGSKAIILVEMAKLSEEIEQVQVLKDKEIAEQKLAKMSSDDADFEKIKKEIKIAEVMLATINKEQL